ncbi:hypothetical protein IFM89_011679 [Coptis chinensis]|uniref:Imidazoleglycerol-phosphate dehydratase n=1 Tax=Coptis chinensis TaxID=261450 RepID=A0A835HUG7_9MAGN|nr:hypothetical protein IFM89_011679 [Coptis chinensis]
MELTIPLSSSTSTSGLLKKTHFSAQSSKPKLNRVTLFPNQQKLKKMDPKISCSTENGSPSSFTSKLKRKKKLSLSLFNMFYLLGNFYLVFVDERIGEMKRVTKETNVEVKINLDGSGISNCTTCIPFLDHMLDQLASHGLFDVHVKATGDIHIDDHHTNEDVALAIGTALLQALGDRKGINRFGDFSAPLDEALVHVVLDLSGRPHLGYDLCIPTERVGTYDTQLVEHFFQSLVNTSGMTLHIRQLAGKNSHHIIEATFKAFARALRQATEYDLRRRGTVPRSVYIIFDTL